jgi:molybdopterin-synthase adenylyltransferase
MNDQELLRYSRQIMLPQVDIDGQEKLNKASVLIIGAGGLGCPVAMYLAAAGVGNITLADDDVVDLSNLQRQIAHFCADLGRPKVDSLAETLNGLNPQVQVRSLRERLDGERLAQEVASHQVVVDASDNLATRLAVNAACVRHGVPLVSGAAIRLEGQVSVFDLRLAASPCYACLYGASIPGDLSCARNGVIAPLVGMIGSIQAMETLKLLAGFGEALCGRLLLVDAATMQIREMRLARKVDCQACSLRSSPSSSATS